MKSFSQTHTNEWTKITAVIPRGFKYGWVRVGENIIISFKMWNNFSHWFLIGWNADLFPPEFCISTIFNIQWSFNGFIEVIGIKGDSDNS